MLNIKGTYFLLETHQRYGHACNGWKGRPKNTLTSAGLTKLGIIVSLKCCRLRKWYRGATSFIRCFIRHKSSLMVGCREMSVISAISFVILYVGLDDCSFSKLYRRQYFFSMRIEFLVSFSLLPTLNPHLVTSFYLHFFSCVDSVRNFRLGCFRMWLRRFAVVNRLHVSLSLLVTIREPFT